MRLALVGYGNVGKAFHELIEKKSGMLLRENLKLQINYIIGSKGGVYNSEGITYVEEKVFSEKIDFDFLLNKGDVDMIVEMTPTNSETGEPGLNHIRRSLEAGYSVVTANKGPILLAYRELKSLADKNNVFLGIGCTTGGALPTISGGMIDLAGAEITMIKGVLNGTTNFILDEMENLGIDYSEALRKAQDLGIAETNPSLDVEGVDTATKLLILTNVLMNENLSIKDIKVDGITKITRDEVSKSKSDNKRYKLVGTSLKTELGIKAWVRLELFDADDFLYGVSGKNKAVKYTTDTMGELTIVGGASGLEPAAASILRDIINISRGCKI